MSILHELNISFMIDYIKFNIISISHGKFVQTVPYHTHSKESYEIHFITEGKGTLITDMKKYSLTKNSLFITGPLIPHAQIPDEYDPMSEYNIYMTIDIPTSYSTSSDSIILYFINTPFWIGKDHKNIKKCIDSIINELANKRVGYINMVTTLFEQLIFFIIRNYEHTKKISPLNSLTSHISPERRQFLSIEQLFLNDYDTLTLSKLSETLCLSTRQTQRLLKKYYNKSFQEKKLEARMCVAEMLLTTSSFSLTKIAEKLGYSSIEPFSNAFTHFHNVSPTKYRNLHK